jgi:excinuclease UvrABC nuclease subunit
MTELYRHFDKDGRLLYVGIAMTAVKRASEHRRNSGWWGQIARIEIERFESRELALAAELEAIRAENPIHNKIGKGPRKEKLPTVYLVASNPNPQKSLSEYFAEQRRRKA